MAGGRARGMAVDRDPEPHRPPARAAEHEVEIAGVEPESDPRSGRTVRLFRLQPVRADGLD